MLEMIEPAVARPRETADLDGSIYRARCGAACLAPCRMRVMLQGRLCAGEEASPAAELVRAPRVHCTGSCQMPDTRGAPKQTLQLVEIPFRQTCIAANLYCISTIMASTNACNTSKTSIAIASPTPPTPQTPCNACDTMSLHRRASMAICPALWFHRHHRCSRRYRSSRCFQAFAIPAGCGAPGFMLHFDKAAASPHDGGVLLQPCQSAR